MGRWVGGSVGGWVGGDGGSGDGGSGDGGSLSPLCELQGAVRCVTVRLVLASGLGRQLVPAARAGDGGRRCARCSSHEGATDTIQRRWGLHVPRNGA